MIQFTVQGKTLADAEGDVFRGIQVVEHACSIGNLLLGEHLPNIGKDLDSYSYRVPLGVTAGICPCVPARRVNPLTAAGSTSPP